MNSIYSRKPTVFYDQRGDGQSFDSMHLPQQQHQQHQHQQAAAAGGFSAYPLDKDGDSSQYLYNYRSTEDRRGRGRGQRRESAGGFFGRPGVLVVAMLTLVAAITKLHGIGRRNNVSWDEAHFGKFGAYYINGTFYHDVHPPLAKMLVGLSEVLAGHNGSFGFKGGETYPPHVNYRFMRMFNAAFGIALTPLAYITCRQLRMPRAAAATAALCVTLDNALCVMSRFILLDAPLLAFTALALTMAAIFHRQRRRAFDGVWWQALFATGLALGLVASTKWVGLFAVALVGAYTAADLGAMFCDTRMPARVYARHWGARVAALIAVPLCVYAACFAMHFAVLSRYDASASFMPAGFQARLRGNPLARQPYDVVSGARIRLHSSQPGAGYLHSHSHKYPTGSQRQQVTGYGFADGNNLWTVRRLAAAANAADVDPAVQHQPIDGAVADGDVVALHHNATDTLLHTDFRHAAPFTASNNEVSAVPVTSEQAKDAGALWKVEIVDAERRMADGRVHPLGSRIRLRSVSGGCVLRATGERLDQNWGWGQAEIACDSRAAAADARGAGYTWIVERNINSDLKPVDLGARMSSSFVSAFITLNRQMWLTNNALVPDHDKHNVLESAPASWPFLLYPMRMVGWDDRSIKYLEVGNPFLWWASAALCLLFPLQLVYWLACWRRRCLAWPSGTQFGDYIAGALLLWGGWALHYLPFFLMARVTYLHHYLPALYFGILFAVYQIHHAAMWYLSARGATLALWAVASVAAFGFWWFSPLTYGWDRPIGDLKGMQWLSSWAVYADEYAI
ncbi:Protein O-mannosyltransferase 2 [Coemansia sp. RSA 1200]|nr:Protein O-mannosyltransferase 2 [Coemansia sp. RSA 1200]